MKKKYRFLVMVWLLIFLTVSVSSPAFGASQLQKAKDQLKTMSKEMENIKSEINDVAEEHQAILAQINVIEKELETTQSDYDATVQKLLDTQAKKALLEEELEEIESEEEDTTELFNKRVRAMFMQGPVSYVEVLLSSKSYFEFLVMSDMIESIIESDSNLLEQIKEHKALVQEKKDEIAEQESEIYNLTQEIAVKKSNIEMQIASKERLAEDLEKEKATYEQKYAQLEKESQEVQSLIKKLTAASKNTAYRGKGTMAWPLPSSRTITSNYGWRIHPILKQKRIHTGIDIAAPQGTKIVAAAEGKVIYVGTMTANGKVVIIDHGGGIQTLYAHLSKYSVSVGQEVKEGDKVGEVGQTGWATGPHLHFEVRKNGAHVSPWNYVK